MSEKKKGPKKPTDYNDLAQDKGLKAVADQLSKAVDSEPSDDSLSPAPPELVGRLDLEECVKRFAFVWPKGDVFDTDSGQLMRKLVFKDFVGEKIQKEWLDHPDRKTVNEDQVRSAQASAQIRGEGGLAKALRRYVYIEPTSDVFDSDRRERVPISDLRHAIAADFDQWSKHPMRQMVPKEKLVFDPTGKKTWADGYINLFRGLPLEPGEKREACAPILRMIDRLVNYDSDCLHWLLSWLARPLQKPGAKMATAVLMHSEVQGSGKSLLFDVVMRRIYGEYSATLGQHQLESQYTEWRSNKLFCLFEEVFSRDQKYQHMGTLKHMISGETQRIEQKFISGWEEANHMNAVFLSNEFQPFPIDGQDRRFFVIWPRETLPIDEQKAVLSAMDNGGAEAFFAYLLAYDLGDFHEHTKPIMTDAKRRLIEFGLPGWEHFFREWVSDELDLPYMPVRCDHLFDCYVTWCNRSKEKPMSRNKFISLVKQRDPVSHRPDLRYDKGSGDEKKSFFLATPDPDLLRRMEDKSFRGVDYLAPKETESQAAWLSRCVKRVEAIIDGPGPAG